MNAANGMPSTIVADAPNVEEDGTPITGTSYITLHTSKGEMMLEYDANTLEVDQDIGIICATLQSMRNFGMLNDAVISMYLTEGSVTQFRLSEIKFTEES